MSGYVVVHATVKDADKLQEYGAKAAETVAAHGGEFICRGPSEVLSGESPHNVLVIISFPSREAAANWYASAEYQALIPIRSEALDSVFVVGGE